MRGEGEWAEPAAPAPHTPPPSVPPPACSLEPERPSALRLDAFPRVTLRVCEHVYIYWRRSCFAANWLLSLRNFLTLVRPSWLSRTHQSHVNTFSFFLLFKFCLNVDIAAVRLLLCWFYREVECVFWIYFSSFLACRFHFKTKPNVLKKTFPSQIFIPQVLKHHFKKKKRVDMFLKGRVPWTACSIRDHLNQVGFKKAAKRGRKKQTLDQQELCDLTILNWEPTFPSFAFIHSFIHSDDFLSELKLLVCRIFNFFLLQSELLMHHQNQLQMTFSY